MNSSDVASLVDQTLIDRARLVLEAATSARNQAVSELAAAERTLTAAQKLPYALFLTAIRGDVVSDTEILESQDAEPAARRVAQFRRRLVDEVREPAVQAAAAALQAAVDIAHMPVLDLAIERRIAAAVRYDSARGLQNRSEDTDAVAEARAEFDAATTELIGFILHNSRLLSTTSLPSWPSQAARECEFWRRWRAVRAAS